MMRLVGPGRRLLALSAQQGAFLHSRRLVVSQTSSLKACLDRTALLKAHTWQPQRGLATDSSSAGKDAAVADTERKESDEAPPSAAASAASKKGRGSKSDTGKEAKEAKEVKENTYNIADMSQADAEDWIRQTKSVFSRSMFLHLPPHQTPASVSSPSLSFYLSISVCLSLYVYMLMHGSLVRRGKDPAKAQELVNGIAHVKTTSNNTIVTISDVHGTSHWML